MPELQLKTYSLERPYADVYAMSVHGTNGDMSGVYILEEVNCYIVRDANDVETIYDNFREAIEAAYAEDKDFKFVPLGRP